MSTDLSTIINGKSILLFDGYCNLCNSTVQFILTHEKRPGLYFCSLQSEVGQQILRHFNIDPAITDSLVLIEHQEAHVKSAAALRVARHLKSLYPLLFGFIIIPPFIRNAAYDYIARHRYTWYGKKDSCMMPQPEWADRFIG